MPQQLTNLSLGLGLGITFGGCNGIGGATGGGFRILQETAFAILTEAGDALRQE